MCSTLKHMLQSRDEAAVLELEAMEELNCKAEIEALYAIAGVGNFSAALAATLQELCMDDAAMAG